VLRVQLSSLLFPYTTLFRSHTNASPFSVGLFDQLVFALLSGIGGGAISVKCFEIVAHILRYPGEQGAGFVAPFSGAIFGLAGGFVCFYMVVVVKQKLGYDDTLDAFGVHGVGGIIGATLTGILATGAYNDAVKLADGRMAQIGAQCIGIAVGVAFAVVGSWIALKLTEAITGGLRMEAREEVQGMDLVIHGEEGYNLDA